MFISKCKIDHFTNTISFKKYDKPTVLHVEDRVLFYWSTSYRRDDSIEQLKRLILREGQNERVVYSLLRCWLGGSVDSFNLMRGSIWTDDEYFADDFSEQRVRLVISLTNGNITHPNTIDIIRNALLRRGSCGQIVLDLHTRDNRGNTLIHCLARTVGMLEGRRSVERYRQLIREILTGVTDLQQLLLVPARYIGPNYETPLLSLIQGSIDPPHYVVCQLGRKRLIGRRIFACENAIAHWLEDLRACGLDLKEYGKFQRKFLFLRYSKKDTTNLLLCKGSHGVEVDHDFGGPVRLIDFQYGELPSQWKFWWSEMTDQYVGEFFSLVEQEQESEQETPADLRMPGSWIDTDSEGSTSSEEDTDSDSEWE